MKKKVFALMAVLCAVVMFTACSSDDDDIREELVDLEGVYGNVDSKAGSLQLNYGENNELLGKSVYFKPTGGDYATITLNYVIPGEDKTELKGVKLIDMDRAGNKFSFTGEDKIKNGRTITYTGTIAEEQMKLTVEVVMPDNDVAGKWELNEEDAIRLVWESDATIVIPEDLPLVGGKEFTTGEIAEMLKEELSDLLPTVLKSITLGKDGDVIAEYSEAGVEKVSTPNLAHYYVDNKQIYALLNTAMISKEIAKERSESSALESLLANGIPVNYEVTTNKELKLFVDKDLFTLIFNDAAVKNLFDELVEKIKEELEDKEEIKAVLEVLAEQVKEVLTKTTKFEIGLNMVVAE